METRNDKFMAALATIRDEFELNNTDLNELLAHLRNPHLNQEIVPVRTFIESPHYADAKGTLYPAVLDALDEMSNGSYVESVLTGSIGSGKTTLALWAQAYQLYVLSCYVSPHMMFDLDPASEIEIVFQSQKHSLAKDVEFDRFKAMLDRMPYFKNHFPYDPALKSQLKFPNRIVIKPVSGEDTAAIGQNVIGGILDEVNFMASVEGSKKTLEGTTYDQAVALYNSIARRRESRFLNQGTLPGMLCLVSSKRYRGQFTDQKEQEAKTNPRIYVYDKRVWEVKPWQFSGDTFKVFMGDETRKPRVLSESDRLPVEDESLGIDIPVEYRHQFESDILNSLRDIGGISTTALHPFIMQPERVVACFGRADSILNRDWCDFSSTTVGISRKRIISLYEPRYVHIDLALSGDSAGVAMGHVVGFRSVQRSEEDYELLPVIKFDLILEVRPPKGGEIVFEKIRSLLYKLRDLRVPLRWVTFDSWQSTDSIQILRGKGFETGRLSVDTKTTPYDMSKQALYDGRVLAPYHAKALDEWVRLEINERKRKVDHPPHGSKDCADAMAGVIYGLSRRRDVWVRHGVYGETPARFDEPVARQKEEEIQKTWDERVRAQRRKMTV